MAVWQSSADLCFMSASHLSRNPGYTTETVCSTQKILQHARMAQAGAIPRDPLRESVSLELDMINIL